MKTMGVLRLSLMGSAASAALLLPSVSHAQDTEAVSEERAQEGQATLNVIVVTAQKRSQDLQDVPVSISVVDGETIRDSGLARFDELALSVPNLQINQDTLSDRISIRGIGSGEQAGFEQSVGTFVDGVYRGRGVQSRFAFLDIASVEVLRGPQGALFGKNTVAGALNITTARPSEFLEGGVNYIYTPAFQQHELSANINIPIGDRIRTRGAFQFRDIGEGWVTNAITGDTGPQIEEYGGRVTAEVDLTPDTLLSVKYEYGEWDNSGGPFEHVEAGPLAALGVEGIRDYSIVQADIDPTTGLSDPVQDFGSVQAFFGNSEELRMGLVHEFGNGGTLTAIGSYSSYEFDRFFDPDVSPVALVRFDERETQEQTTFEIRYASDTGGSIEYLFGAFYLNADLFVDSVTNASIPTFELLTRAGCAAGDPTVDAGAAFQCGTNAALVPLVGLLPGVNRVASLEQDTETYALFGQVTWRLNDTLRFTGGLRYSNDQKSGDQSVFGADYAAGNRVATNNPIVTAVAEQLLEFTTHNFTDLEVNQDAFTWSANTQWDVSDNVMLYGSVSTGFKAGGINSFFTGDASGGGALAEDALFDEENALSFEIGLKSSLFNDSLELNFAAFRTEFDDLQVAVFGGNTTFNVANAADATSQGVEVDFRWQATGDLFFSGGAAYTDFAFDNFPNQACTNAQFLAFRQAQFDGALGPAAAALTAADCTNAGVNDLQGRTAVDTPEFSSNLAATYSKNIGSFLLKATADYNFQTSVFRQGDLDPILQSDPRHLVNVGLRFGPEDGPWELGVLVRNLTDTYDFSSGNDVPISFGGFFAAPIAPRSVSFNARVNF